MDVNHRNQNCKHVGVQQPGNERNTFFSPFNPLFLGISADQLPDSATMANPNCSRTGRINSPVQNLWEDGITPALSLLFQLIRGLKLPLSCTKPQLKTIQALILSF